MVVREICYMDSSGMGLAFLKIFMKLQFPYQKISGSDEYRLKKEHFITWNCFAHITSS
jgi:hypothetical protein